MVKMLGSRPIIRNGLWLSPGTSFEVTPEEIDFLGPLGFAVVAVASEPVEGEVNDAAREESSDSNNLFPSGNSEDSGKEGNLNIPEKAEPGVKSEAPKG